MIAIDPANLILSPNVTSSGMPWLDRFLALGGGAYVDAISWHLYPNASSPEDLVPLAAGLS